MAEGQQQQDMIPCSQELQFYKGHWGQEREGIVGCELFFLNILKREREREATDQTLISVGRDSALLRTLTLSFVNKLSILLFSHSRDFRSKILVRRHCHAGRSFFIFAKHFE